MFAAIAVGEGRGRHLNRRLMHRKLQHRPFTQAGDIRTKGGICT